MKNVQEILSARKKSVVLILSFMFLIGLIGFASVFICGWVSDSGVRFVSSRVRFPLNVYTFDVGSQGHIVCFSNHHYRIQLFSEDGQFLRGWFVDNGGFTAGRLLVDSNDIVHFASPDDRHITYDLDGNIIEDSYEEGIRDRIIQLRSSKKTSEGQNGSFYKIRRGITGTRITRRDPKGEESVVISDPLWLWVFQFGYPLLIFFCLPLLVLSLREVRQGMNRSG